MVQKIPRSASVEAEIHASIVTENWIAALFSNSGSTFEFDGVFIVPAVAFRIAGSRFSWDIGISMPIRFFPYEDYDYSTDPPVYGGTKYSLDWLFGDPIPLPLIGITYRIN